MSAEDRANPGTLWHLCGYTSITVSQVIPLSDANTDRDNHTTFLTAASRCFPYTEIGRLACQNLMVFSVKLLAWRRCGNSPVFREQGDGCPRTMVYYPYPKPSLVSPMEDGCIQFFTRGKGATEEVSYHCCTSDAKVPLFQTWVLLPLVGCPRNAILHL